MPDNWKTFKLADVADDIAMGPFGSNLKIDNFIETGVPVIRGGNLHEGGFNRGGFVFVSEEKANSLKRCLAYPDDLVFTHRGTLGQVGIIPRDKFAKYLVSQSQMRLTVNKNYIVPRFLYYFFKSPLGQRELLKNSSQVGVPAIANPTKSLKEVVLTIPKVEEQSRIATLLSSLDDKIELNLQMNATLEAIAQAMYQKLNRGNEMVSLSEYIELNPRLSIKKEEAVKYVEMSDLPEKGISVKSYIYRPFTSGSKFQQLDTLLARITPCLENGKTALVDFLDEGETAYGSTEFIVMRGKNDVSPYYVYLLARNDNFREFAIKSMAGTSGRQRVQTDMLYNFELNKIEPGEMRAFHESMEPLFGAMKLNSEQNMTLAQIRDSLLPKLMNGKIRVAE